MDAVHFLKLMKEKMALVEIDQKLIDLPAGEIEQLVIQAQPSSAGELNHIFDMLTNFWNILI